MKNKKYQFYDKLKLTLVCLTLPFLIASCEDRPNNRVTHFNDLVVQSCSLSGAPRERPDIIIYEGYGGAGTGISSMMIFWDTSIKDTDGSAHETPGIAEHVEILETCNPMGGTNLWNMLAPNGQPYGSIHVLPYLRTHSREHIVGQSNAQGMMTIAFVLGDPSPLYRENVAFDPNWAWPDSSNTIIDTMVRAQVRITKSPEVIRRYFGCYFGRSQYQGAIDPKGGAYETSLQWKHNYSCDDLLDLLGLVLDESESANSNSMPFELFKSEKAPKDCNIYPFSQRNQEGEEGSQYIRTTQHTFLGQKVKLHREFTQLRYYFPMGWNWYYLPDGGKLPTLSCDINDVNDIRGTLDASYPYCWWVTVEGLDLNTIQRIWNCQHPWLTVLVRPLDENGNPYFRDQEYVWFYPYEFWQNNGVYFLTYQTEWLIFSQNKNWHGYHDDYYDSWGNCYCPIYMPNNSQPEIILPAFGDFNGDSSVDWRDIALFSEQYQCADPYWMDKRFKDPNNLDESPCNLRDFIPAFHKDNWMK